MKKISVYIVIVFLGAVVITSCGSGVKSSTSETTVVDSFRRELSIAKDQIQSLKPREVTVHDSILGLFAGHFKPTSVAAKLQQRYDSMEKAVEKDYDYFTLDERFYELASAHEKNYFYLDPLYGVYALRKPNAISIHLNQIGADSIIGRSVCAGNERPLKLIFMEEHDDTIAMRLQEPGDDKYDGTFDLTIDVKSGVMTGTFTPYRDKMPHKQLTAKSAEFKYQPDGEEWAFDRDYFAKNISLQKLTEEDVENQSKQRLRILRNIIYARHGYSFKNKDVREFFESYSWYVPYSTDVRDKLTTIEKENIALIKRYEAYAEDYYDDFGR